MIEFEDAPDKLVEYLEDQDLNETEVMVKNFHHWLREEQSLTSGVIVSYVKRMHRLLKEHGTVKDIPGDKLDARDTSAYNKYQTFLTENPNLTTKTGENKE